MLTLALVTLGGCRPRETISGYCGRRGLRVAFYVDMLHYWETGHCSHVAECEERAFIELEYTKD